MDEKFSLVSLLKHPSKEIPERIRHSITTIDTPDALSHLAPIEASQEIWASGVTYMRSREARKSESSVADVYDLVYDAARPELFMKSLGWRARGHNEDFRIRGDSDWNVPEPELVLVLNAAGKIVGYSAGNDVSSRSIEGENPLYLPQAKIYRGSCVIGPEIIFCEKEVMSNLEISLEIWRKDELVFDGISNSSNMKRSFSDLVSYLFKELDFPEGVFLMTGTGIVPNEPFTLNSGDIVVIKVGELELKNKVE